jgi:lysosomal alpha-mannosidase
MMMLAGSKQSINISMEVSNNFLLPSTICDDLFELFHLARQDIRRQGVQYIIDSAIESLLENPDRRFIYVEMAFFWRWWVEQTDDMQNKVRELVNQGQFCRNKRLYSNFFRTNYCRSSRIHLGRLVHA